MSYLGFYSVLEEPLLQFGGTLATGPGETDHQEAGLKKFGPFDLALAPTDRPSEIRIALLAPDPHLNAVQAFLGGLQRAHTKQNTKDKIGTSYPGAAKSFRTSFSIVAQRDVRGLITTSSLARVLQNRAGESGFDAVVKLYEEGYKALSALTPRCVVLTFIPTEFEERYWSSGAWKASRRAKSVSETEQQQLTLWKEDDDIPHLDREPSYKNLRRCLKAAALRHGVVTQLLRQGTVSNNKNDPAAVYWNLGLGLYYKGGGIPWRMNPQLEDVCYIGIAFGIITYEREKELLVGIAEVFNTSGEGLGVEVGEFEAQPTEAGYYMTEVAAHALIRNALAYYKRSTGHLPHRVVLHKTTPFKQEEIRGAKSALKGVPWTDMVWIQDDPPHRLMATGKYPPQRRTFFAIDPNSFLLYTRGYLPQFQTFPGVGVPIPLLVKRTYGETDLRTLATDILRMTKMNWNSTVYSTAEPVTLIYARDILDISKYRRQGDPVISDLRYYI